MNKHSSLLLAELVKMWERYKLKAKCLSGFFQYLDYNYVDHNLEMPKSLKDISVDRFCVLVCDSLFHIFRDATITMILLERDGKQIDHNILKNFMTFFLEIGESLKGSTYCKVLLVPCSMYAAVWFCWSPAVCTPQFGFAGPLNGHPSMDQAARFYSTTYQ